VVKLPTKVYPKLFFSYQVLIEASNKHKHSTFGLQLLKKSPKYWFFEFFGHFSDLQGRGAAIHTQKFVKSLKQKMFLLSVRNFLDYSSLQFLSLKFSHTKTFQPNVYAKFQLSSFYSDGLRTFLTLFQENFKIIQRNS
jgi:hypothetical protein